MVARGAAVELKSTSADYHFLPMTQGGFLGK